MSPCSLCSLPILPPSLRGAHALSSLPEVRRWLHSLSQELAGRLAEDEALYGRRAGTLTATLSGGLGAGSASATSYPGRGGGGGGGGGGGLNGSRSCPMRRAGAGVGAGAGAGAGAPLTTAEAIIAEDSLALIQKLLPDA